jgi:hypothetical protein
MPGTIEKWEYGILERNQKKYQAGRYQGIWDRPFKIYV